MSTSAELFKNITPLNGCDTIPSCAGTVTKVALGFIRAIAMTAGGTSRGPELWLRAQQQSHVGKVGNPGNYTFKIWNTASFTVWFIKLSQIGSANMWTRIRIVIGFANFGLKVCKFELGRWTNCCCKTLWCLWQPNFGWRRCQPRKLHRTPWLRLNKQMRKVHQVTQVYTDIPGLLFNSPFRRFHLPKQFHQEILRKSLSTFYRWWESQSNHNHINT